jgi:hypothetical protein
MLYSPPKLENPTSPPPLTGRYLAHNRLDARARARLAADIINGRISVDVSSLTVGQVVRLCRSNKGYVNELRFPDRAKRRQQKKLERIFAAIGPDARAEACRAIGVERVWVALAAAL